MSGFDDNGRPVESVGFDYDAIDHQDAPQTERDLEAEFWRRFGCVRILELLTALGHPKSVGQAAFLLRHLLRAGPWRTQRELARQLQVTPGRLSHISKRIESGLDCILSGITAPAPRKN